MPVSLDDFLKGNSPTSAPSTRTPNSSAKTSVSLDDFLGSSQGDNSSASSAPSNQPQQSTPSSGGGFFSNLLHGAENIGGKALGAVGDALNSASKFTGFNHVMGAWNGAMSTPVSDVTGNNGVANFWDHIRQGWQNPDQAQQAIEDHINSTWKNPALRFAANVANGPPIPVGPVAKALGVGAKALGDVSHLTPIVSKATNAATNNSFTNGAKDVIGTLFKKGYGTSPDTLPTMNGLDNTISADQYAIQQKMSEMAQSHGLTPQQMSEVPHVMDTGVPSQDPQVNQAVKELSDTLSGGFNSVHGKVNGTDAELRNGFTSSAPSLKDLFAQNAGNPIRSGAVGNYYPRRFNNTPEEVAAALDQYNGVQKGLSTNGAFNKAREFPTLQDAINHGLKPEMNPYVAVGQRMSETSKAINTDNAIKQLLYAGVVKGDHEPGMVESTTKPFTSYMKTVTDPKTGEDNSFIQRSFMKPQDQSAIQRAIDPQGAKTGAEQTLDKLAKPYDAATRVYKGIALYNPIVHGHNIGYNGDYLGGAKGSDILNTMKNLKNDTSDPWYQRALAAGAVSSDTKGGGAFSDVLRNSVAPQDKSFLQKTGSAINYARHGVLWDADKAMRTSIFRQAVEGGATDSEAAAKANKFMVNYNNTTPFESAVMKRIFPFYSWMKGNIPLQAEQWVNNTPKQMYAQNAVNATSYAMSGDPSKDNKMDTGKVLSDGSHVMVDPYMPADDPTKLLRDGIIPFLFNRSNPMLKEGAEQAANKAYSPIPLTTANGKDYLNKTEIRPPGSDQSFDTRNSIAHILNTLNPLSGGAVGGNVDTKSLINNALGLQTKATPDKSSLERIIPWLGAFTSHYNPDKETQSQPKQDQYKLRDQITFKKSQGQYVSKAEKKAAYRKIK